MKNTKNVRWCILALAICSASLAAEESPVKPLVDGLHAINEAQANMDRRTVERAKLDRLEVEMTVNTLELAAVAVAQLFKNVEAQAKAFGNDPNPKLRETIQYNLKWCVDANLQINAELERQRRKLQSLPVFP